MINRALHGSPRRLLVVSTGNIGNNDLIHLIETNLDLLESALADHAHVELSRSHLIIHE